MIGKILGDRYELIEKIGEGGMSFVYKARCKKLNRNVAVKILKDSFKENEEIIDKFKREATSIANLSNSNIVNVLDVGTQEDIHYIVMEYVEGKTLKDIIVSKGKLPYEIAITIAIKVAKALECAHRNNIIHRDVKPQNILVTEEGVVKVTDFGIAKSMDSSTIAHTNSVLGSAHYFSPEQAKGGYIDCRTDLYSLGIVLYEMVTGVVPFDGDSPVTVAVKHIQNTPIQPKEITSSIPDSLNILILKAIEKDPLNRYQTAKEIIADLEKIKNNPNAKITKNNIEEEQFTRVMSPVNLANIDKQSNGEDIHDSDYNEDDEDDEDEEIKDDDGKHRKKKNIGKALMWIVACILIVSLGAMVGFFTIKGLTSKNDKIVEIPTLIGTQKEQAKSKLEELGLKVVESTEKSDKNPGEIIRMEPNEGTKVEKGSTVNLIISAQETKITVPDLSKMNIDEAKNILKSLGLMLGKTVEYENSDTIPKDHIIRSIPNDGTEVEKDTRIDIVVSKGPEIRVKTVPNVLGITVDEAKGILENAKFKINSVKGEKAKDEKESGKIYKQDPGSTYEVKEGTEVTVYYYDKYEAPLKNIKTETILGKTKKEAENWAKVNKISITFNPSNSDENWIVSKVNVSEVTEGGSITVDLKNPKPDNTTGGNVNGDNNAGESESNKENNDKPVSNTGGNDTRKYIK